MKTISKLSAGIGLLEWWATWCYQKFSLITGYIFERHALGLRGVVKLGEELLEEQKLCDSGTSHLMNRGGSRSRMAYFLS